MALGNSRLPCDPGPGPGGVLLGGVVARFVGALDPDSIPDLERLTRELEHGRRIAQPRLRHRLQVDTIGLSRVTHRLVTRDDRAEFEFDENGAPEQQILGAVYAAGILDPPLRRSVMAAIRRAIGWGGPVGADLIATLSGMRPGVGGTRMALADPTAWALERLGFGASIGVRVVAAPSPQDVQRRYREKLREVHPDHGAEVDGAAQRIAELSEARRILTGR